MKYPNSPSEVMIEARKKAIHTITLAKHPNPMLIIKKDFKNGKILVLPRKVK